MFYTEILRPILFKTDPERIHSLAIICLGLFSRFGFLYKVVKKFCFVRDKTLQTKIGKVVLPNPIGLAAGFDKDISAPYAYSMLGFGCVEFGSVTNEAQDGNPKPRLWRLPKDKSLIVNYGLNNSGALAAQKRLKKLRKHSGPIGISIAPTSRLGLSELKDDYINSFKKLCFLADYITLNISCPNVIKCESVQQMSFVKELLVAIVEFKKEKSVDKDVFIKISSEMSKTELDDLIDISLGNDITGIIATNLVKDRDNLPEHNSAKQDLDHPGGISGKLLQVRSNKTIEYIYSKSNGKLVIIGVGGVFSAKDAYEKIKAGATAIQLITGFIYNGPLSIRNINLDLLKLLKKDGFTSLEQAIGVGAK